MPKSYCTHSLFTSFGATKQILSTSLTSISRRHRVKLGSNGWKYAAVMDFHWSILIIEIDYSFTTCLLCWYVAQLLIQLPGLGAYMLQYPVFLVVISPVSTLNQDKGFSFDQNQDSWAHVRAACYAVILSVIPYHVAAYTKRTHSTRW